MKFNSYSDSSGLCQDTDFLVGSTEANYPLRHKARNANEWVKKCGVWIWQSSGDWEYDDSNLTTLPIATRDLVAGQGDYALPTTIFKLDRVEVMDANGDYQLVKPIDKSQVHDESFTEFLSVDGLPIYYEVVGNSLILKPAPAADSVTTAAGLQIYVGRDTDSFTSSDTTKEPGFSEYFHRIVSIGMALDYATAKGFKDKVTILKRLLYGDPNVPDDKGLKGELQQAYGSRHRDVKTRIGVRVDNRI